MPETNDHMNSFHVERIDPLSWNPWGTTSVEKWKPCTSCEVCTVFARSENTNKTIVKLIAISLSHLSHQIALCCCVSTSPPPVLFLSCSATDDGSGLPYDNILELRSAKIRNLLRVQHFSNVKSFHSIHYEDLVEQGTQELIDTLEQDLNVTANCVPLKGQSNMGTRPLMDDFVEYMKHHVDWTTEALIGYGPETLF